MSFIKFNKPSSSLQGAHQQICMLLSCCSLDYMWKKAADYNFPIHLESHDSQGSGTCSESLTGELFCCLFGFFFLAEDDGSDVVLDVSLHFCFLMESDVQHHPLLSVVLHPPSPLEVSRVSIIHCWTNTSAMNNYCDRNMLSDALTLAKGRHVSRVFFKKAFYPLTVGFKTGRFHNFAN